MTRSGWNPAKRNRNIGTAKAGHGQDNTLTIPRTWNGGNVFDFHARHARLFELRLDSHSLEIPLFVEPPRNLFFHACTPHDVQRLLELVPAAHLTGLAAIVLRQPTKKEQVLRSVWGAIYYDSRFGGREGSIIYLDAQYRGCYTHWSKSLTPQDEKELNRLEKVGFSMESDKRRITLRGTPEQIRHTQLYCTLPHEIGHLVDLNRFVNACEETTTGERERIFQWFCNSRPTLDKEFFANRYAEELIKKGLISGELPFPRRAERKALQQAGLDPEWF